MANENDGAGGDALGRDLPVTIRIGPDGTLYANDITPDLLPVLRAVCPGDPSLEARSVAIRDLR